ncbi:hypothetical protein [Streptomyces sp. CAU 1734]|uniref:hypothetical protein n=1 Tax=Streptomyces sp. CAU 1734 TaxID=3140360 RepID=UPI0032617252
MTHGERDRGEGVFEAATGDGPLPAAGDAETTESTEGARAAEVRAAFAGLSQIRRLSGAAGKPAAWEVARMVRAVALALEAAGLPPSALDPAGARAATGYRVRDADRPGAVVVEWLGPAGSGAAHEEEDRLRACARALTEAGWEALLYRGPRRRRFLEVEPGAG